MFKHSLMESAIDFWAIARRGAGYYDTTAFSTVLEGL
jgi:hypothetical protein